MSLFKVQGNTYWVHSDKDLVTVPVLPPGTYNVAYHSQGGFYLETVNDLKPPAKLYGTTERDARRILRTFKLRSGSTGCLFTGTKGSGKTLLTKTTSQFARTEDGYPTLLVNAAYTGNEFLTFLQKIEQPCIVIFDEFEKIYDKNDQPFLLTMLDGVCSGRKLYMLTSNDKWGVNNNMINRPGRIFYYKEYRGLDASFIEQYCQDNLNDKSKIPQFMVFGALFYEFNFDMLYSVVEEANRYPEESIWELASFLNTRPEADKGGKFKAVLKINGLEVEILRGGIVEDPLKQAFALIYRGERKATEAEMKEAKKENNLVYNAEIGDYETVVPERKTVKINKTIHFDIGKIKEATKEGALVFTNGNHTATLTRHYETAFSIKEMGALDYAYS